MIPITEKLLSGAGGWQALKAGRELLKAERVSGATYEPPLLAGSVREGQKNYRAGLRIRSASDIENLCTCREAREWGKVCAHSLAVGLAYLAPPAEEAPNEPAKTAASSQFGDTGELVKLHVILPPNFATAWAKRQVMVGLEAERASGQRVMLDALPRSEPFRLDPPDRPIVEQLVPAAGMNTLSAAAFLQLIATFRGHERITFGRATRAQIALAPFRPAIAIERNGSEAFRLTNKSVGTFLVADTEAWVLNEAEFREIGSGLPPRLTSALQEPLSLQGEAAWSFFALELPLWREVAEVTLPADFSLPAIRPVEPEFFLRLEGSLPHLRAALTCRYGDRPAFSPTADREKTFVLRDPEGAWLVRNLSAELAAVARLEAAGFVEGELRDSAQAARFFAFDYPALARDWEVSLAPSLDKARDSLESIAPVIDIVSSGEDWFELKYSVATADGEHIPLAEVQRLLRSGQSRMTLKNGKQAVFDPAALEDFEELLRDVDPRQRTPGVYRLERSQAGYLANTAAEIGARLVDASRALATETTEPDLGSLGEKLRDYQRTGVRWLAALAGQKLGGILADEMGLGKTVQTLAFLQLRQGHGPALIVCPTSLLANWQREAARFTPHLRALLIDGANRPEKIAQLPGYDLGLTSYGLLRRDVELYRALAFDTVVLDEAQHIKNPDTQNAQAAFDLRGRQRFVLTGTPMENSVRDLWSLMNFVAPGYLGSRSDFRERYERPLANGPEPVLQRRLARRLRPFLLRRRKAEVAQELPAKIEQVVPCDLGPAQRSTYDAILREIQSGLGSSPNDGAKRMKMLTGLLRLRQVCCDLRLLERGSETRDTSAESAKLDLLEELLGGKHRRRASRAHLQPVRADARAR